MITALTMCLEDEHRLFEVPEVQPVDMKDWLDQFPEALTETAGMGLAERRSPIVIELKATSTL